MPQGVRSEILQRVLHTALLAAAVACILPEVAVAQNIGQTTGQIEGVVLDAGGLVMPGVTVTVTSPALVGERVVVTLNDGRFVVPGLPPGLYKVEATIEGFTRVVVENIDVRPGQILKPNIKMSPGLTESVTVVGSPVFDVMSTAISNNISAKVIDELPKGRSWDSIVQLAPAVNTESTQGTTGISFRGASISENSYIIDGVDTTAVVYGSTGQDLALEFVNEVQVKSGFVGAEYGGSLGGIVNVVTKSGSNDFRFTGTLLYSGSGLTAAPRKRLRVVPTDSTKAEYVQDAEDPFDQYDFGLTAGGRIVRDRVWFFGGWMPQYVNTNRTVTFLSNGQTENFTNEVKKNLGTAKITARAAQNLNVNFSTSITPNNSYGLLPSQDGTGATNVDYAANGRRNIKYAYAFGADWVPSPRFFLNAFVGYHDKQAHYAGTPIADRYRYVTSNYTVPGVPPEFQGPAGFETSSDNYNIYNDDDTRFSLGVTGTVSFEAGGRHLLKFGAQYARPTTYLNYSYTGERVDLHWGSSFAGQRGQYGYWRAFDIGSDGEVISNNQAIFIQDSWSFSNLTLNLGLRTEREILTPYTNTGVSVSDIEFGFGEKLAPRLGVAWDVRGDSSWKVYVNGGVFYDLMKLQAALNGFGGGAFNIKYYTLDTYDYNLLNRANPLGRQLFVLDLRGVPDVLDPAIKPAKTVAYDAGTEFQLAPTITASVGYVHRAVVNTVEDFYVAKSATTYQKTMGNPAEGMITDPYAAIGSGFPPQPKFERTYDGVDLQLAKRFANNWAANVSYTISRLTGNYDGLADSDQQAFVDVNPNTGIYCDYLEGCYTSKGTVDEGRLPNDRPHQFKVNGSYTFDFGLTAGLFFQAYSGTPITALLGVNQATVTHPEGRGGNGRNPFVTQTDMSVNYALRLGAQTRMTLTLNVLNLFDQDTGLRMSQNMLLGGSTVIAVPKAQYFQGYDYQAAITAQGIARDPRFLMADRFQYPRSARIGVRFDF